MAKKFNLALISLFALGSCFMGLETQDLSVPIDSIGLLVLLVAASLLPSLSIVTNDYWPLANGIYAPDLGKWSLNPWQPLRSLFFFGCLCLSVGVPGSISVLVFQGIGRNLSFPVTFLVIGIGLTIGSAFAAWKFQDRLIRDER